MLKKAAIKLFQIAAFAVIFGAAALTPTGAEAMMPVAPGENGNATPMIAMPAAPMLPGFVGGGPKPNPKPNAGNNPGNNGGNNNGLGFGPAANNFSAIGRNIVTSSELLPGLLTGISYMLGVMMAFQAIVKMKDHVENPHTTAIKESISRLGAGGALFALPIVFEAMYNTIGTETTVVAAASVSRIAFNVY